MTHPTIKEALQVTTDVLIPAIERLRQQLAECERERDAHYDEMQRAWAELKECERDANEQATTLHNTICSANRLSEQLASVTKERDELAAAAKKFCHEWKFCRGPAWPVQALKDLEEVMK